MEKTLNNPISFRVISCGVNCASKNDHEVTVKMHVPKHPISGIHLGKSTRRGKYTVTLLQNVLSASNNLWFRKTTKSSIS